MGATGRRAGRGALSEGLSLLAPVVETPRAIWGHPENRGRRARRLATWFAWQVWERTVKRPWTIPFHDGLRMVCHPHDHVTTMALYYGLYDTRDMRFLLAWLRPGDTFLDVGANVGPYTLLSTRVPGARAVAFEPGALAFGRAQANLALNGVADRVTVVPVAVSDVDGTALLTLDRWATNALVGRDHDGPVQQVETMRLDTYAAVHDLGRVTLVKVDVEGHEAPVLAGAEKLLEQQRPALIVEVNDPIDDLRRVAEDAGYVPVSFDPGRRRLAPRPWPRHRGGNIVLVPDGPDATRRLAGPGPS